jgi:iron complex transport system ATP-binding protein
MTQSSETLYQAAGLGFAYGALPVIRDLDLRIDPGRFYGLLGPNGCGKTTLLDLMAGLRRPQQGSLCFKGRPLARYSRARLARELALVPQNFYIDFDFRVHEVVRMGRYPHMPRFAPPRPVDVEVVARAMRETDVLALAHQPVTALSGGERQRVVFARALAQDAAVFLLDEATSNLDIRHALQLLGLMRAQVSQRRRTVIAVFQDINLAAIFCDVLLFMQSGRIMFQGETAQVLSAANLAAVFGVEAHVAYHEACRAPQVVYRW